MKKDIVVCKPARKIKNRLHPGHRGEEHRGSATLKNIWTFFFIFFTLGGTVPSPSRGGDSLPRTVAREHRGKGLPVSAAVRAHPRANTRGESPRAREGADIRRRPGPRTSSSSSSSDRKHGAYGQGSIERRPPLRPASTWTARAPDSIFFIIFTVLPTAAPFPGHVLVTASVALTVRGV
jgi:hypothetical protein